VSQYRKKPVVVEAFRFVPSDLRYPLPDWLAQALLIGAVSGGIDDKGPYLLVVTLEGNMRADAGDWVIKGVKDELYPCKNTIFRATYEQVADTAPHARD
jgi:hypothetical protein